jgi:hypothetical protein
VTPRHRFRRWRYRRAFLRADYVPEQARAMGSICASLDVPPSIIGPPTDVNHWSYWGTLADALVERCPPLPPPLLGRVYLGYMAMPWTCVAYDPDTDSAGFRFGEPGYHPTDEVTVMPSHKWRHLVLSSDQPDAPADAG